VKTNPKQTTAFNVMLKPVGAKCNLACAYCYYLAKEGLYLQGHHQMSLDVLKSFTRQYIQAQQSSEVVFNWQGGEPLLRGLEFFKAAVSLQRKYSKQGVKITNTLQTNGTLLDDKWCQFFHQHEFLIGVSIDGPPELHDAYRVDRGGSPSFDRVMAGLTLLKKHNVEYNILATVHAANATHPLDVYRFFRDTVEAQFIQFIPIVERQNNSDIQAEKTVTEHSVSAEQYGNFLINIFDEWVHRDVGKVFVQIFDVSLGAWLGQPGGLCIFAPTCGTGLAMEHNGDLYACDHFVEPDFMLGNVKGEKLVRLVTSAQQQKFGSDKQDELPVYCLKCKLRFACHGGCPKNRIIKTPNGEDGLNYLCEGYQAFFSHIDQPMKIMAELIRQRQSPAQIMQMLNSKKGRASR
jgi:uncharacterized protein